MSVNFYERITEDGNFWFMKNINRRIYENLFEAESNALIDFVASGVKIRDALEVIIDSIIKDHGLGSQVSGTLYEKISFLKKDKSILPDLGIVKFQFDNGKLGKADYYTYIRRFGNSCAHESDSIMERIKTDYPHLIQCLKCFHEFLLSYYSKRIHKATPSFNENLMPIRNYHIRESFVPKDIHRSKCNREYVGFRKGSTGRFSYAVLRRYNKEDLNEEFLLRNAVTFQEASHYSISTPEGMAHVREVVTYTDNRSTFYIIAYEFNREPHMLNDKILKEMDLGKRVKLCKRIADSFYDLHNYEVPIYHRLLSHESIYVCDFGKEWVPYIVKLDFAKIDSADMATVFMDVLSAKEALEEAKLTKYIAPEWLSADDSKNLDWGKMDIYSLGVLFCDILSGRINTNIVDFDELEAMDLSDDMLDLLDMMLAESPSYRCDMEVVKLVVGEEAALWT